MPNRVLLLVAVFSLGAVFAIAMRYRWRFSLRTLLISMTIVALLTGLFSAFDLWQK